VAALARSWQDQHAELARLRTLLAALVEQDDEPGYAALDRLREVDA